MPMLELRKLADKSSEVRVPMFDEYTGEKRLVNPETPGTEHEPWPTLGYEFKDEAPDDIRVSTRLISNLRQEGVVDVQGESIEHQPGGPAEEPWRSTHTFIKLEYIIFHMVDGDYKYRVTENPGKYSDDEEQSGFRVDWTYTLELANG